MLDFVIGPVTTVYNDETIQVNVTHIGTNNKFRYNNYEIVLLANNNTPYPANQLYGKRIKCHVRYRDTYNRLYSDIELL